MSGGSDKQENFTMSKDQDKAKRFRSSSEMAFSLNRARLG